MNLNTKERKELDIYELNNLEYGDAEGLGERNFFRILFGRCFLLLMIAVEWVYKINKFID